MTAQGQAARTSEWLQVLPTALGINFKLQKRQSLLPQFLRRNFQDPLKREVSNMLTKDQGIQLLPRQCLLIAIPRS